MEGKYSVMQEVIHIPAFLGLVSGSVELERLAGAAEGRLVVSQCFHALPACGAYPAKRAPYESVDAAAVGGVGYGHALLWGLGLITCG